LRDATTFAANDEFAHRAEHHEYRRPRRPDQIRCGRREIVMNPLVSGLPIDEGWAGLHLLTDEVLPHV
jgi:hypothetical protein